MKIDGLKLNKLDHLFKYLNTIKYMKARQIGFQLLRRIYNPKYADVKGSLSSCPEIQWTTMGNHDAPSVEGSTFRFSFLNQSVVFRGAIDWNYAKNGKLWTYNLNYFDFLSDPALEDDLKTSLMRDFTSKRLEIKDGMESYPVSLRIINWIKYCSSNSLREFDDFIYSQACLLSKSFEYHLLGNHLLENAYSLLFAAFYFRDESFYDLASRVLREQLKEQILADGAHFERSPMYQQILFTRLLDALHFSRQDTWKTDLITRFETSAGQMLSWLLQISYRNGNVPMVNDCSPGSAPETRELQRYATSMDIEPQPLDLGESGYRMVRKESYECFLDLGNIGPDYIPGHAHSDTFNFEFYINGQPLIVDTGISTYENNDTRQLERSTSAHNTVKVDQIEQSEMWGAFRVARRAHIIELEERENYFRAIHDGYKSRSGVLHQREFEFKPNQVIITDTLLGGASIPAVAYFHFPVDIHSTLVDNVCDIGESKIVVHKGISQLASYEKAERFNVRIKCQVLEVKFLGKLVVAIDL